MHLMINHPLSFFLTLLIFSLFTHASEKPTEQVPLSESIQDIVIHVQHWAKHDIFVTAIKKQNNQRLSLKTIKQLDKEWLNTKGISVFMKSLMENSAAIKLFRMERLQPYYNELFLMDNQGAIVAMTNKTSDYWQGDEEKFQMSFNHGKGAVHIGEMKFDESTQNLLVQISVPIMDDLQAIGAITVGINVALQISPTISINNKRSITLNPQEKRWLAKHPNIRLGFGSGFEPFIIVDESGKQSGILVDLLAAINQQLGTDMAIDVSPWQEVVQKAEQGEIDGILSTSMAGAEKRQQLLTQPIHKTRVAIYASTDNSLKIQDLNDLSGLRIAYVKNQIFTEKFIKPLEISGKIIQVNKVMDGLKLLLEDKADVFIGAIWDNYHINQNMLTGIHLVYISDDFETFGIAVRQDWPELVTILDKAINAIGKDEINAIHAKWVNLPPQSTGHTLELLTSAERSWLKKHPTIRLGFNPDMPPLVIIDKQGKKTGILVDILQRLQMNISHPIALELAPWPEMLERIQNKQIDGLLDVTQFRAEKLGLMTTRVLDNSTLAIFSLVKKELVINMFDDLRGLRIAYPEGTLYHEKLESFSKNSELIPVAGATDGFKLILENKADVYLGWTLDSFLIQHHKLQGLEVIYTELFHQQSGHIGIRSDWKPLVDILNKALAAIGEDGINAIYHKWLNLPTRQKFELLTADERKWVQAHPNIRLGYGSNFEPGVIVDKQGGLSGSWVDIVQALNQHLDMEMKIDAGPWTDIVEKAKQRQIDAVLGSTIAGAITRRQQLTHAISHSTAAIYSRIDLPLKVNSWNDLQGLRIAHVRHRSFTDRLLEPLKNSSEIIAVSNVLEGLKLLVEDKADVYVGGLFDNYHINRYSLYGLHIIYMDSEEEPFGISVRDDWPELIAILNKGIKAIGHQKIHAIQAKWISLPRRNQVEILSSKERSWIKSHPNIRLGFGEGYEPYVIAANDGQLTGILIDAVEAINKKLNIDLSIELAPWAKMVEKTQARKIDGLLGASAVGAKKWNLLISNPFSYSNNAAFSRVDANFEINSWKDLAGKTIVHVKNRAISEALLAPYQNDIKIIQVDSVPQGLNLLLENKADIFVGVVADNFHISKHTMAGLRLAYIDNHTMAVGFAIRSDWPELVNILNKAIEAIGEGKFNAMSSRWINLSPQKKRVTLSEKELRWLAEHPNIRLGFTTELEPWLIKGENDSYSGILADLIHELESRLGFSIDIEVDSLYEIKIKAKDRVIDGLLSGSPRTHRENNLTSTHPFAEVKIAAYGRTDASWSIDKLEDIVDSRIVFYGTSLKHFVQPFSEKNTVTEVSNPQQGFEYLIERKADVFIGASYDNYYIVRDQLAGIQPIFIDTSIKAPIAIAIRKDWQPLVDILNKGLAAIGKHDINDMVARWISQPLVEKRTLLTKQESIWLKQLPTLKLAVYGNQPPLEYIESNGKAAGITTDYVRILAERLGINIEPVFVKYNENIQREMLEGRIDLSFLTPKKNLNDNNFVHSIPYLDFPLVVLTQRKKTLLQTMDELKTHSIAVLENSTAHEILRRDYPSFKLIPFSSMEKALLSVSKGKTDFLFGNVVVIDFLQKKLAINNLKIALTTQHHFQAMISSSNELSPLIAIINKSLEAFTHQEKRLIFDKWMNQPIPQKIDWLIFTMWGAVIFALVTTVIIWQQRKIRQSQAKAIVAFESSLKIKNDFLTAISHELRTPMNAIFGGLQLFQKKSEDVLESPLDVVLGGASDMMRLVNDILSYTEVHADQCRINSDIMSIKSLLEQLHKKYRLICEEKQLKLEWEIDKNVPIWLELDEEKLLTVLEKLLENAVKYTDNGFIRFSACCKDNNAVKSLCIIIEDSGIGISAANIDHIFEAFKQKETGFQRTFGGLGIGLSICKKLLETMKGSIKVISTENQGSCFSIVIPASLAQEPVKSIKNGLASASLPILIVEDNKVNQMVMKKMLENLGYQSLIANHGKDALVILEKQEVSVILMDLQMPVMDGFSCTEAIRFKNNQVPIIAVTANLMDADKLRCTKSGMDDYIKKPVKMDILEISLSHYIEAAITINTK